MHHGFRSSFLRLQGPLALAGMLLALAPLPANAATLQINEVLAGPARDWDGNGAVSTRDDEWVEIVNVSDLAVDLAGFIITDGDSLPRYALSGTLGSGERRVVYGRESYDWERANGYPAFGLSLANSGDAVVLWQVQGPDTAVVDAYTYRSHEAAADRSVGRLNDTGAWTLFDGLNPYTGTTEPHGTGCNPSPSAANACGPTSVRRSSWGALKLLYK
jgi:hypothetical protein